VVDYFKHSHHNVNFDIFTGVGLSIRFPKIFPQQKSPVTVHPATA
jgi:hypothetical protein